MYPILFEFGSVSIYALWFFVTVGFIMGSLTFTHLCKRTRVSIELFTNHSFSLFLIALICGRLTFVILHSELFFYSYGLHEWIGLLGLWDKGISFWGSLGGFVGALYLFRNKTNESLATLLDLLIPAVLVGMVFGSFGAFLDGSFYGTPTDLPWGVTFRSAYVKYISDIHPTQLYSLIYELFTLGVVIHILSTLRGTSVRGLAVEVGFTLMSFFIFFEEFFRGDESIRILGIRLGQIIALITLGIGSYLLYRRFKNPSRYDADGVTAELLHPFTQILRKLRLMKSQKTPE